MPVISHMEGHSKPTSRMLRKSPNSFSFSRIRRMNEVIKMAKWALQAVCGSNRRVRNRYYLLQVPVLKTIHYIYDVLVQCFFGIYVILIQTITSSHKVEPLLYYFIGHPDRFISIDSIVSTYYFDRAIVLHSILKMLLDFHPFYPHW
jgi:hypothetical protein